MMEGSPTTIPPLLLRNLLTSMFIFADKSLLNLGEKYKLLHLVRCILVSSFLFFLQLLPSFFPTLNPSERTYNYSFTSPKVEDKHASAFGDARANSSIARALSQLLSILNDIPVSSRKYEVVRSLAERLIDENLLEGCDALREVNCRVLSAAFSRTLSQLEAAVGAQEREGGGVSGEEIVRRGDYYYYKLNRVLRAVRYYGDVAWTWFGSRDEMRWLGTSAEKLSAELLWLAQKLVACGNVEEAVCRWASASNLAWMALSAEPRLQCSLVKVSAFLFKHAKEMRGEEGEESKIEQQRQTKMKMLTLWLPLLCRASNGTDAPVLSIGEKAELERVLEEMVETLEQEEQEKVLSLWLHHFTHCPSSDWPNLHSCYGRWCTAARKLLLLH